MLQVSDFWAAIDKLAEERALSLRQLARLAGLPDTLLLPKNRVAENGAVLWPSLETLTRLVVAAGITLEEFARMLEDIRARREAAPPSSDS